MHAPTHHHHRPPTTAPRRGGFVIVAVLMVVTVLSLAAYQYGALMDAEVMAAERIRKTAEAKALAESGVHFAIAYVADPDAFAGTLNKQPVRQPGRLPGGARQGRPVGPVAGAVLARLPRLLADRSGPVQSHCGIGLTDEAGKLNINALIALDSSGRVLHDALMKLPNMTDEIAWSIVDWIDPDEEPNAGRGREPVLRRPRRRRTSRKNGPLDTVEELLLVKGVTPALLFGNDRNRNGKLDPGEDDGLGASTPGGPPT